jgi:molybdopterin-biosynthesis enzyme MoeA-like protein
MTMRGLALALNRPLELNPGALQLVKEHYKKMEGGGPKLTRYRMKMATIPRGSVPIPNPVGTAPGILSYKAGTAIFSLPGVPSEMKSIFAQFILPFLKTYSSNLSSEIQLRISGVIESTLAPVLDRLRRKYSALYFKSHPQGIETKGRPVILLHIYTVEPVDRSRILAASAEIIHELSLSNTSS